MSKKKFLFLSVFTLATGCGITLMNVVTANQKTAVALPNTIQIVQTGVNITNRSDKATSFVVSAIHTTQEKTPLYSKKYQAYISQTVITDPVEALPTGSALVLVNDVGNGIIDNEKILGLIVFGVQRTSDEEIKQKCSQVRSDSQEQKKGLSDNDLSDIDLGFGNVVTFDDKGNVKVLGYYKNKQPEYYPNINVCQVFQDELTVTVHTSTWMSNPRKKPITYGSHNNFFNFPEDFVFDKVTDTKHTTPNYQKIIDDMKAAEKKLNKSIFPAHYFKLETLKNLPLKEISNVSAYAHDLLNKPIPIRQATLGTLLDCGKYNGIAAVLVKISIAVIMLATGGGVSSFVMDMVDNGMSFGSEIKDLKARG